MYCGEERIYTGLYKDSSHQTIHSDVEMILEMSSSIFSKYAVETKHVVSFESET